MDTLADLASMQNHQPVRTTPPSADGTRPAHAQHRPSFDIAMVDTPKELLRSDYTGTSLSLENQQRLGEFVGMITENPSAYEAHIEIIKILHQGLVDHTYPPSDPDARNDPRTYDLLSELRQARENADKLFAVGEDQWLDWLQDESLIAQSIDERVGIIELCKRAVDEEYASSKLWATYGEWMLHCYTWAHEHTADRSEEDQALAQEVFRSDDVLATWETAIQQTKYDMATGHLVWNKYIHTRFPNATQKLSADKADQLLDIYQSRLMLPHAQWDATFQNFSAFVTANFPPEQYEHIMAETSANAAAAKAVWSAREQLEGALARAVESGDRYAEYQNFLEYITWEKAEAVRITKISKKDKRREPIQDPATSARMINSLYQRAELRIPSVVFLWEEHASYLAETRRDRDDRVLLELLQRATKHCPWSGSLWKRLLLASEIAEQPFVDVENIKHDATKTGMLDAAGIEESLKVHDAWCGYLLRRTRRADATEEDSDVAEMGIRTSMEAVQSMASKVEGEANVDASFRLQRKYIEYLKGQGRFDNARKQFDDAVTANGKYYRFWLRFYEFEMQASLHINSLQQSSRDRVTLHSSAPFAVAILKKGLEYHALDYPEYLMEALINHCEDYEDADELQWALLLVEKAQKQLTLRRQQEAELAAEQAAVQPVEAVVEQRTEAVASNLHIGKRKRDDDQPEDDEPKRQRSDHPAETIEESSTPAQPKRDREHASILVLNLPADVSESRIRQYFSSCGEVVSLRPIDNEIHSYVVEFKDAEEAQYALSRNEQDFDGAIITVKLNSGNTLYVTNYPASADESWIRELFVRYGEIVSTRFPSLSANKRRRFCYVEFRDPSEARAALELNGTEHEGLALTVAISDPSIRKQRDSGTGLTIFVGSIPFKATEIVVKEHFARFGSIESIKMPSDPSSKSRNKGICFITFTDKPSAEAALQLNGQEFQGRKLKVSLVQEKDDKSRQGHTSTPNRSASARSLSPLADNDITVATHDAASRSQRPKPTPAELEAQRARTIFLTAVPDTVNEAQIRSAAQKAIDAPPAAILKAFLRPQYGGALIEFTTPADAGKAALALEGHEFVSGRPSRVVSEAEMKQGQKEIKSDRLSKGTSKKPTNGTNPLAMAPAAVRRPGFGAGANTRRGGHLGKKTGLGFRSAAADSAGQDPKEEDKEKTNGHDPHPADSQKGPKSQDDFRKLLSGGK
jgi:squamous cell carcinoma antigen recognized by T-cells 3